MKQIQLTAIAVGLSAPGFAQQPAKPPVPPQATALIEREVGTNC